MLENLNPNIMNEKVDHYLIPKYYFMRAKTTSFFKPTENMFGLDLN